MAASSDTACTGAELALTLRATGGVAPYTWRLSSAPRGLQIFEDTGAELEVSGEPSEAGSLVIEVEDATGETALSEERVVYESPEVETWSMPAICAGAGFAGALEAFGGDPDEYVWSAELVAAEGLPGSLEELGLHLDGSTLVGDADLLGGAAAPFAVTLRVRDAHCASSDAELELSIVPAQSDECPSIEIVDAPPVDALPPACLGNSYHEALTVDGGEPPYSWVELSVPPGLHFDTESAGIYGIAEADGVLSVELTDASSHTVQKSYPVRARDACWLGYVASEPFPARLELVDGLLFERQPDEARRTLPDPSSEGSADSVVDFSYSPNGRFVAYRLATADSFRVELARLSDGQSLAVDVGGSVREYAWSAESTTLAVAFTAAGQNSLGGVDVSAVDAWQLTPGVPLAGVRQLASVPAPSADSVLTWSGPGRLVYLSSDSNALPTRRLVTAALGQSGFAAPVLRAEADFSASARVQVGGGGAFVADPDAGLFDFFAHDGSAPVVHAGDLTLAASGAFAAAARSGALQVFRPLDASAPGAVPFLGAPGCTSLLGWASEGGRIACADERAGTNQVALFDLRRPPTPALVELSAMPEAYAFAAGAHTGRRRALSPSGRWFAFSSAENLFVARVDGTATRLAVTLPVAALGAAPGALAFAPDETFLLVGAANSLSLLDLERGETSLRRLTASAVFDETCSERFVDGSAASCGNASSAPDLAWSSGSDLVAFRSSLGTLGLIDVSHARDGIVGPPSSPDTACSEGCLSTQSARFQPE